MDLNQENWVHIRTKYSDQYKMEFDFITSSMDQVKFRFVVHFLIATSLLIYNWIS